MTINNHNKHIFKKMTFAFIWLFRLLLCPLAFINCLIDKDKFGRNESQSGLLFPRSCRLMSICWARRAHLAQKPLQGKQIQRRDLIKLLSSFLHVPSLGNRLSSLSLSSGITRPAWTCVSMCVCVSFSFSDPFLLKTFFWRWNQAKSCWCFFMTHKPKHKFAFNRSNFVYWTEKKARVRCNRLFFSYQYKKGWSTNGKTVSQSPLSLLMQNHFLPEMKLQTFAFSSREVSSGCDCGTTTTWSSWLTCPGWLAWSISWPTKFELDQATTRKDVAKCDSSLTSKQSEQAYNFCLSLLLPWLLGQGQPGGQEL